MTVKRTKARNEGLFLRIARQQKWVQGSECEEERERAESSSRGRILEWETRQKER